MHFHSMFWRNTDRKKYVKNHLVDYIFDLAMCMNTISNEFQCITSSEKNVPILQNK